MCLLVLLKSTIRDIYRGERAYFVTARWQLVAAIFLPLVLSLAQRVRGNLIATALCLADVLYKLVMLFVESTEQCLLKNLKSYLSILFSCMD